jgi:glutamate:GABA antiporter
MNGNLAIKHAKISAFQLAMITVAYVASIRALASMATYGFSTIFYYIVAAGLFLLPQALVSAELATAWPERGGVYIWVKKALGARWGFLAIWMQFLSNIISLPAYLSFVATVAAYVFMPEMADNKYFLITFILIVLWGSTLISFSGMKIAGWINTFGAFTGTFAPVAVLLILGTVWMLTGHNSQIVFSAKTFFPQFDALSMKDIVFLAGLLFSFTGMETSGAHALDVKDTCKNYPRGIFLAAILVSLVGFSSLSIAIVVPKEQLNIVSGIMQAFTIMLNNFHLDWAVSLLALLIVLGAIGAFNASVIGPSKGLFGAASGGEIPPIFTKTNQHGMPINMLLFQAIIITIFTTLFLFMPSVASSYWLIMGIVIIVYLGMYVLLFISGIILRYKFPKDNRPYKVPGGNLGMWLMAGLGLASTIFGIIISFFPPSQLNVGSVFRYEAILLTGVFGFIALGLLIYRLRKPHWIVELSEK